MNLPTVTQDYLKHLKSLEKNDGKMEWFLLLHSEKNAEKSQSNFLLENLRAPKFYCQIAMHLPQI